jgi:formylglycine-generating enzyme required for sulfatase activity
MKARLYLLGALLVLIAGIHQAIPQVPYISSFSNNGLLVCTNLSPGSSAAVYSSSSLVGPWYTMKGLNSIVVASNETIQINVPVSNQGTEFYRVLGVAAINPLAGMALIPAGSFTMGDFTNMDGETDALPTNVYVSAFYIDTNLATYAQWQSVFACATNNGYAFSTNSETGKAPNHPVQTLDWYDAVKWCNARSQQAGLVPVYYTDAALTQIYTNGEVAPFVNWTNSGYRLPTEAEWEKAARGGLVGQRFPRGDTISESQANYQANTNFYSWDLGPYDGYNTNFDGQTQPYTSPVGFFPANGYGLNDMAGNVQEWCWDWYGIPYGLPTTNNPTGPGDGSKHVLRGGFWGFFAFYARCANRGMNFPYYADNTIGFRCVKVP